MLSENEFGYKIVSVYHFGLLRLFTDARRLVGFLVVDLFLELEKGS